MEEEGAKAGVQAAEVRCHHYVRHVRHRSKVSFKYISFLFGHPFLRRQGTIKKKLDLAYFMLLPLMQKSQAVLKSFSYFNLLRIILKCHVGKGHF